LTHNRRVHETNSAKEQEERLVVRCSVNDPGGRTADTIFNYTDKIKVMKKLITCLSLIIVFKVSYSQNVGIGTNTPAFKLDVQGRMRVKTGTTGNISTTSGIWMEDYRDGTNRIFFGMQDSIRAGFYGSGTGGTGWQFNFNAKTGYVGIGRNATNNRLELDDADGAGIGLYYNGTLGGSIAVTSSSLEINAKNGSTACFPNPCPASDLILLPPLSGIGTATTGNVGIGINSPGQKLSVNGAMGIYNGSTFVGSLGRNGTDFLINAKSGSSLTNELPNDLILQTYGGANATSGNVGIGTMSPTAKLEVNNQGHAIKGVSVTGTGVLATSVTGNALEVNGKMQIAGNGQAPAAGKVLTSDVNGVATWQGAIAFAAHSLNTNDGFLIVQPHTSVRIPFGVEEYDLSNNYTHTNQSPQYTFIAPVAGIYLFTANIHIGAIVDEPMASFILVRNGVSSTIACIKKYGEDNEDNEFLLSREVNLLPGDQVFVQIYHKSPSERVIYADNKNIWFTGRLVIKL
jgi:hypothetical protein